MSSTTAHDEHGQLQVLVQRLDRDLTAAVPAYALPGDVGADVIAAEDVSLAPGGRAIIGTGIAIALPQGYACFVHPRSGLAARCGFGIVNSPGTFDSGYRGEIKVIAINHGDDTIELHRGERIAQLVLQRYESAVFIEVDELPASDRATGGLGSTGGSNSLDATRCVCDGAVHHTPEQNRARRPFLISPNCPVHAATAPTSAVADSCDGCASPDGSRR